MKRLLLVLLGLAAGAAPVRAAPGVPWRAPTYSTTADRVPAAALLRAFATQQGLPLQLNAPAEAPVSGRFQDLPADLCLQLLVGHQVKRFLRPTHGGVVLHQPDHAIQHLGTKRPAHRGVVVLLHKRITKATHAAEVLHESL